MKTETIIGVVAVGLFLIFLGCAASSSDRPTTKVNGFTIDRVGPYTCVHWGRRDGGIWCERTP